MSAVATRTDTGEVLPVGQPFDMATYLADIGNNAAFEQQKRLAALYDRACAALIGDNDVQREGSRTFKKKSAWLKLGRYFSISTVTVRVEREVVDGNFVAIVTKRAVAPWGQSAEASGACSTDEATGRRVITVADAIATADTRANNRAISNLIAMGEVSAEEIGDRPSQRGAARSAPTGVPTMPFGKSRGTPLSEMATTQLQSALDWAQTNGKFEQFQREADAELVRREGGSVDEEDAG